MSEMPFISKANIGFGFAVQTILFRVQCLRSMLVIRRLYQVHKYVPTVFPHIVSSLDTGHFFNTSLIQGLVFEGIVKGQEYKVWAFFKGLRSFRGPQKQN